MIFWHFVGIFDFFKKSAKIEAKLFTSQKDNK